MAPPVPGSENGFADAKNTRATRISVMSNLQSSAGWPEDFCGSVRLFPLPNLVLFPHAVQPLHIFEPRYCDMLEDALSGDRLIAMALLKPGWENSYQGQPKIWSAVCVGRIISHTATDDGRHNILLVGVKRGRILREHCPTQAFRMADVEILEDIYPPEESGQRAALTEKLQALFFRFVPDGSAAQESFKQLVGSQLPLGILTDTITYALDLPIRLKAQLLAENNVDMRCRILTRCLEQKLQCDEESDDQQPPSDNFPPRFSDN